jgi:hypothetical protein
MRSKTLALSLLKALLPTCRQPEPWHLVSGTARLQKSRQLSLAR